MQFSARPISSASAFIFWIEELLDWIKTTLVAIPIGMEPSCLTLQLLPFFWLLFAYTSTLPELKYKLGWSAEDFKTFVK